MIMIIKVNEEKNITKTIGHKLSNEEKRMKWRKMKWRKNEMKKKYWLGKIWDILLELLKIQIS